jgi:ABC-type thiamine transport system substrate-binding protein
MPVISVSDEDPWVVGGWAFRQVLARTANHLLDRPQLLERLVEAEASYGLYLDQLDEADRQPVIDALRAATNDLISEWSSKDLDPFDASFLLGLQELQKVLSVE